MVDEENLAASDEGGDENRDFTEITSESYGDKVGDACSGTCTGFFLFFGSIGLLIFNEGRTVKRAKDLAEGRDSVLSTSVSNLTRMDMSQEWENRLVHTTGDVGTDDTLTDYMFGVGSTSTTNGASNSTSATSTQTTVKPWLKLRRSVEMFQWQESTRTKTIKNADGSSTTQTTYHYNKQWSSRQIDSSRFRESLHTNPSFPFNPLSAVADPIFLGDRLLLLTDAAIAYWDWYEPLNNVALWNIPDTTLRSELTKYANNGFFYRSAGSGDSTSSNPNVGDARVTFHIVEAGTISIIAKVAGTGGSSSNRYSLGSYTTSRGGTLLLVEPGRKTADEMFAQATADNTLTSWVYRFVGFFLMVVSILMILQPIATAVDIIPFIGDYLQGGLEGCIFPTIAILIALPVSLFVVALSWLAYRPYIALPICIVSLIVMVWLRWRHKQISQQHPSSSSLPPPNEHPPTGSSNDEKPSQNATEPTIATDNAQTTYPSPPIMSSTTLYTSTYHFDSTNPMAPAVPIAEGYETIPVLLPPTTADDLYPVSPTTAAGTSVIVPSAPSAPAEEK